MIDGVIQERVTAVDPGELGERQEALLASDGGTAERPGSNEAAEGIGHRLGQRCAAGEVGIGNLVEIAAIGKQAHAMIADPGGFE